MRRGAAVAALVGLLLLTGLVVWQGVGEVTDALAAAGWGLLLLAPYHLLVVAVDALGWWVLFPSSPRPSVRRTVHLRWISESVNQLLPAAQVGGEVVRARLLARAGFPAGLAGGTVVAALTAAAVTQVLFGLSGAALLLGRMGTTDFLPALVAALAGFGLLLGIFWALQRRGLFGTIARAAGRFLSGSARTGLALGAERIDAALRDVYGRRGRVAASLGLHLLGWILGTGEVWLALWLLGAPVSLAEALLLESLGQAVRGVAFLVPGAWGVQEGAYLLLGAAVGLGPAVSLALSLAKRARELLLGVPGLLVWQAIEGAGLARGFRGAPPEGSRSCAP